MLNYNVNEDAYTTKLRTAKPSVVKVIHDPFKAVAEGDIRTLRKLLDDPENPLNVNKGRWSGFSLLHRAASQGCTDICQILLENGARLNERTTWGWHTPLHLALANGWEETAKFLITAGADIDAKNKSKEDMCAYAAKRGYKLLASEFGPIARKLEGMRKLKERNARAIEVSKRNTELAALAEIEAGNAAKLLTSKRELEQLKPEIKEPSIAPESPKPKAPAERNSPSPPKARGDASPKNKTQSKGSKDASPKKANK